MDLDIRGLEDLLDTRFTMTKAERLDYGQSLMTHAMVFQGVNLDENGKPNRWRVENSWGKEPGKDGYYLMTDRWFDEYMYQKVPDRRADRCLRGRTHRSGALGPHGLSGCGAINAGNDL